MHKWKIPLVIAAVNGGVVASYCGSLIFGVLLATGAVLLSRGPTFHG